MLRRQIENTKYIALSEEFNNLIKNNHQILDETTENLDKIYFVIPDVKMQRGLITLRNGNHYSWRNKRC